MWVGLPSPWQLWIELSSFGGATFQGILCNGLEWLHMMGELKAMGAYPEWGYKNRIIKKISDMRMWDNY